MNIGYTQRGNVAEILLPLGSNIICDILNPIFYKKIGLK